MISMSNVAPYIFAKAILFFGQIFTVQLNAQFSVRFTSINVYTGVLDTLDVPPPDADA